MDFYKINGNAISLQKLISRLEQTKCQEEVKIQSLLAHQRQQNQINDKTNETESASVKVLIISINV